MIATAISVRRAQAAISVSRRAIDAGVLEQNGCEIEVSYPSWVAKVSWVK